MVPRIIDHYKDDDPHLDQSNLVAIITICMVVLESASLGAPEEKWPGVCSNPSTIEHPHPKPNHRSGGEESTYTISAWTHKQRPCMPMGARTTKGKIRTSYHPKLSADKKMTKVVHFVCTNYFRKAYNASVNPEILNIIR